LGFFYPRWPGTGVIFLEIRHVKPTLPKLIMRGIVKTHDVRDVISRRRAILAIIHLGELNMNGCIMDRQELSRESAGTFEVPSITLLGSLDDSQGTTDLSLSTVSNKPIFAIIYNAI
jgi:hypothetical protein